MRPSIGGFLVLWLGINSAAVLASAQSGDAIPDLAGLWERRRPSAVTLDGVACGPANTCGRNATDAAILGNSGTEDWRTKGRAGEYTGQVEMHPGLEERYRMLRPDVEDENASDAVITDRCLPHGATFMMFDGTDFEIRQFANVVLLLFESDHWVRRVYMDGRNHPAGYSPTWMGHSVGRYEENALVIETVGLKPGWIDPIHPYSDALRLTEEYRRVDQQTIELDFTVDDPKIYTRPWKGKRVFEKLPPGSDIYELVVCEEFLEMGKQYSVTDWIEILKKPWK